MGLKPADGSFQVAVLGLAVLQHQAQAGNAVGRQPGQVPLHGRDLLRYFYPWA
jgi:hypothetical protein